MRNQVWFLLLLQGVALTPSATAFCSLTCHLSFIQRYFYEAGLSIQLCHSTLAGGGRNKVEAWSLNILYFSFFMLQKRLTILTINHINWWVRNNQIKILAHLAHCTFPIIPPFIHVTPIHCWDTRDYLDTFAFPQQTIGLKYHLNAMCLLRLHTNDRIVLN